MKRLSPLLLVAVASSAQAGPESLLNPLAMMNPMANPMAGYGAPFGGGYGNPLANLNTLNTLSTLASLGIIAAPLVAPLAPNLLGSPFGQMGYPAMQMAPNMMSYGHYGQYGGGPFGGNPYMQRGLPTPLSPPAFSPSVPTMPFSPAQGTLPLPFGMPSAAPAPALAPIPSFGGLMPGFGAPAASPSVAPAFGALPGLPFLSGPGLTPAPGLVPGLSPAIPMAPPAQSNPWGPAPAAAPRAAAKPAPQAPVPMASPWMMMLAPVAPVPTPAPAVQPAPAPAVQDPAAAPMDPAALLQMLMKPMEEAAQAVGTPAPK